MTANTTHTPALPVYSQELHAHLKELHTNAAPAPWAYNASWDFCDKYNSELIDADGKILIGQGVGMEGARAAETLIEARNALPTLLAEIERLQERERILGARLARVNFIAPITYQLALSAGQGVGA